MQKAVRTNLPGGLFIFKKGDRPMKALNGYKTYIVAAIGVGLVVLQHAGFAIPGVQIDDNVVLMSVLGATIRHGVSTGA